MSDDTLAAVIRRLQDAPDAPGILMRGDRPCVDGAAIGSTAASDLIGSLIASALGVGETRGIDVVLGLAEGM